MNVLDLKKMFFPDWYFDKVLSPIDIENYHFYYMDSSFYDIIEVKDIVGTFHEKYQHKTWLQMLSNLKRHKDDTDIEYITSIIQKMYDDKSVVEYDGKYYISGGNHRLCQAKFLEIKKVHCYVTRYRFNHEDFNLHNQLLANGFKCKYKYGNFRNIYLGDINIHVRVKTDIAIMIKMYRSIQVNKIDLFIALWNIKIGIRPSLVICFENNDLVYKNLRLAVVELELRKKIMRSAYCPKKTFWNCLINKIFAL